MNEQKFFASLKKPLFKGRFSKKQVSGINAILSASKSYPVPYVAYLLATAYHETGCQMWPVKETVYASSKNKSPSDKTVIRRLNSAYAKGQLKWVRTPYWDEGWFGRGLVQITHESNYKKMGDKIGVNLVKYPSKALDLKTAVDILVVGSVDGDFTGKKLGDYLDSETPDYMRARRVINGNDKARLISTYAVKFDNALRGAGYGVAPKSRGVMEWLFG